MDRSFFSNVLFLWNFQNLVIPFSWNKQIKFNLNRFWLIYNATDYFGWIFIRLGEGRKSHCNLICHSLRAAAATAATAVIYVFSYMHVNYWASMNIIWRKYNRRIIQNEMLYAGNGINFKRTIWIEEIQSEHGSEGERKGLPKDYTKVANKNTHIFIQKQISKIRIDSISHTHSHAPSSIQMLWIPAHTRSRTRHHRCHCHCYHSNNQTKRWRWLLMKLHNCSCECIASTRLVSSRRVDWPFEAIKWMRHKT